MARFSVKDDLIDCVRNGMTKTGRSQSDLARQAGSTTKHVGAMLNGRVTGSLTMWQRLVDAAWAEKSA